MLGEDHELKFSPPIPPEGFLRRSRLEQILASGLSGRLTLLRAPIGYGKTSLLAWMASEWGRFEAASTAKSLGWFTLDPWDNDASRFVDGLLKSVRRLVPGFGKSLRAVLRATPDPRGRLPDLLSMFQTELLESGADGLVIVLDDFQHISDVAISDALDGALRDLRVPLRLIVATSSVPHFYLSPLRSMDALVELSEQQLRFTPEETIDLLLAKGVGRVGQELLDEVMRETGGRPSAVNIAVSLAVRNGGRLPLTRLGPSEHGYRRLARELSLTLPAKHRQDLLKASLLRYLDPESCRVGAGIDTPSEFLELLVSRGMPVTRAGSGMGPLVLEPAFRAALQHELRQQLLPSETSILSRRVAAHYESRGLWADAVHCLQSAGDAEAVASVVEEAIDHELEQGNLDQVLGWLRALPTATRRRHPRLMVREARLALARDRVDDARVLLVAAQAEIGSADDRIDQGRLFSGWAVLYLSEGRYRDALRSAQVAVDSFTDAEPLQCADALLLMSQALEMTADLDAAYAAASRAMFLAERGGRQRLVVNAMLRLAELAHLRGRLSDSLALSGRAVQRAALLEGETFALGEAGGTAAISYLERGQVFEASVVAARTVDVSEHGRDRSALVRALLALAAASERLGQRGFAVETLSQAQALAAGLPSRLPELTLTFMSAAASLMTAGKVRDAGEKARLALRASEATPHQVLVDRCRLMVAATDMLSRRSLLAVFRVRKLCGLLKDSGSRHWLAGGLQLLALGYQRFGLDWLAGRALRQSLIFSATEHYAGTPLGLPIPSRSLLKLAVSEGVCHKAAALLLGVDPQAGAGILGRFLVAKSARVRKRAAEALEGLETGTGRAPAARLLWPGLSEGAEGVHGDVWLRSFGGLNPYVGGSPVEWPSPDARNLVAYLLVNRAVAIPMERALRDIWPGVDPAEANLRTQVALYQVREALGAGYPAPDASLEGNGMLYWDDAGCSVDTEAFREGIRLAGQLTDVGYSLELRPAAVTLLEECIGLYRGAFLAGVDFDWCRAPRQQLRAQFLGAARGLMDHYLSIQDWTSAVRTGLKSLSVDPLQETVVMDLMVSYRRLGEQDAALRQYLEFKRRLAKDRGTWPSKDIRELRLQLLGR